MSRRDFLRLAGSAAVLAPLAASCLSSPHSASSAPSPTPSPAPRRPIRAVAFDLFTIFDPRSVVGAVEAAVPGRGAAFAAAWRTRQFDYAFLRAAAGRYADFRTVTDDALQVTAREQGVELTAAARSRLVDAYSELSPWADSVDALRGMRGAGLRLAPLANYAPGMIDALLRHAGIRELFEQLLSTDLARTYKPDPRAYQLGVDRFGLDRAEIAFAAFGGWDAAGATWFGYPTFWVNRLGVALEQLVAPTATGRSLSELAAWVAAWPAPPAAATAKAG